MSLNEGELSSSESSPVSSQNLSDRTSDDSDDAPLVATGKELAPNATRTGFRKNSTVYAWYDIDEAGAAQKRAVKGIITKVGKLNKGQSKWDRLYDVDFGENDGDGVFPYRFGDLFTKKSECEQAYSAYK